MVIKNITMNSSGNGIPSHYSIAQVADILGVSKETLRRWDKNGNLIPVDRGSNQERLYTKKQLEKFEAAQLMFNSNWQSEFKTKPRKKFTLIELFAGGGGLAIGMEKAGFKSHIYNEIDKDSCNTLRKNRPNWNVVEGDVSQVDFTTYKNNVDVLSGGFPCQAFSYAGKKLGFEDTRGTLFYEFARAVKETNPKVILGENVSDPGA